MKAKTYLKWILNRSKKVLPKKQEFLLSLIHATQPAMFGLNSSMKLFQRLFRIILI
jgi:hypothetical protein